MMTYKIDWVENKKDDWKVATLVEIVEGGQTFTDVSINKVDKKGRAFPHFDEITVGQTVHGNLWQSPTNQKYTLFAPDEPRATTATGPTASAPRPAGAMSAAPYRGGGATGVKAAQERKAEGIATAQENKTKGVMASAAMRDSTLIALELIKQGPPDSTFEDFQAVFKRVRGWYLTTWNETEKMLDVPF